MKAWYRMVIVGALSATAFAPVNAAEIKVGAVLPMTGAIASWGGLPHYQGMQVALDEVNSSKMLGEDTIKFLLEDDASEKTQTITLVNRLITRDKVSLIVGPVGSPLSLAAAPVADQLKVPMIALAVSEEVTKARPWVFKIFLGPSQMITEVAKFSIEKLDIKKLATVVMRENDAMVAYQRVMRDYSASHGVKEIMEETVSASDTDFTALATKLAGSKLDAIFISMLPEAAANLVIQTRQAGLPSNVKFVAIDQMGSQSYATIGGDAVKGTFYPTFYSLDVDTDTNKHFIENYKKKFKAEPDQYAAAGYTAMMVGAIAIKNAGAGATAEKIRDALAKIKDIPTVLGKGTFSYDENHNPHCGTMMMSVQGNRPQPAN